MVRRGLSSQTARFPGLPIEIRCSSCENLYRWFPIATVQCQGRSEFTLREVVKRVKFRIELVTVVPCAVARKYRFQRQNWSKKWANVSRRNRSRCDIRTTPHVVSLGRAYFENKPELSTGASRRNLNNAGADEIRPRVNVIRIADLSLALNHPATSCPTFELRLILGRLLGSSSRSGLSQVVTLHLHSTLLIYFQILISTVLQCFSLSVFTVFFTLFFI